MMAVYVFCFSTFRSAVLQSAALYRSQPLYLFLIAQFCL
uniref:Uncharacterized protein n=1 Tax=Anguilla anguilla TaxID=7936 RepID=A0A0E9TH95_ANGAN